MRTAPANVACPKCGSLTKVIDCEGNRRLTVITRRRACRRCGLRVTTKELLVRPRQVA